MTPPAHVTTVERIYFAAVALLAAWVGAWGVFAPSSVERALPFPVPPLHARFLGAVYLSGFVIMIGSVLTRSWSELRPVPVMTAIWTGGLAIVSLLHLDAFPPRSAQTWVWFGAYVVYPLVAIALALRHRGEHDAGDGLPRWLRRYLDAQGLVLVALGALLLVAPGTMSAEWPWPVTPMVARIYAAPFLSYGVGSMLLARRRSLAQVRVVALGLAVFAAVALTASVIHRDLFSLGEAADIVWFAALAVAVLGLTAIAVRAVTASGNR